MRVRAASFIAALVIPLTVGAAAVKEVRSPLAGNAHSVLWTNPADIATRDLFHGPGGHAHAPRPPFTFTKEDRDGTNPKFEVKDAAGTKWKVKMGLEAKPETAASRLVWAAGYHPDEEYYFAAIEVREMPKHLQRGAEFVTGPGTVRNVRLKRPPEGEKKAGEWKWRHGELGGTREFNGLRVLMALVNNWDLKDENTAIYDRGETRIYRVSDLGATFGCPSLCFPKSHSRGDLEQYRKAPFIRKVHAGTVDFQAPATPSLIYIFSPVAFFKRVRMRAIGHDIPRADAKWMGDLLGRLSKKQIQDAFRAADYSAEEVEAFSEVVAGRIAELRAL